MDAAKEATIKEFNDTVLRAYNTYHNLVTGRPSVLSIDEIPSREKIALMIIGKYFVDFGLEGVKDELKAKIEEKKKIEANRN